MLVVVVVGIAAFLLRTDSKIANPPHPYAANLKFSDMKMSAAENFIGSTVTYLDGTVTNAGDKTVSHAIVHVSLQRFAGPGRRRPKMSPACPPDQRAIS